ncbi:hypothetical protein E2542_SST17665 [Spatholobus suberectus]|nr:hypothetical protein E2542_SST17665 [Spatholobus suberectus]
MLTTTPSNLASSKTTSRSFDDLIEELSKYGKIENLNVYDVAYHIVILKACNQQHNSGQNGKLMRGYASNCDSVDGEDEFY